MPHDRQGLPSVGEALDLWAPPVWFRKSFTHIRREKMTTGMIRARNLRRTALQALVAAASSIACFGPSDAAYGTTFTFTSDLADMRDPNAWTPNGIPGPTDVMFIGRRAG